MTPAILALDAGTSNAKAVLCEVGTGAVMARAGVPLALQVLGPREVEQDAEHILSGLLAAAREACAAAAGCEVVAIALTNQRESVVAWERSTGRPLGPMLSWQDSRTSAELESWDPDARARVKQITGLTLDAMYSAPKMRWLLDQLPGSRSAGSDVVVGTLESWLIARLTGEAITESGNASRTLLMSLSAGDWDDELLNAFDIPRGSLPPVRPSNASFGVVRSEWGAPLAGVPIVAVLADSHAALFAHSTGAEGIAKATLGTGTSVMVALPRLDTPREGIDVTVAWWLDHPTYALEGNIVSTGQAIDWVANLLDPAAARPGGIVVAELAATVDDSSGVPFVPAFTGLGAPHWDRGATALVSGMTAGSKAAHLARAALESVGHQVADVVEAMVQNGSADVAELRVDGGGSSSDLLLQVHADVVGMPVVRVREPELSAIGAARLASVVLGSDPGPAVGDTVVDPGWTPERRAHERRIWQREVARARMRIEEI
ncbi:MAG: FGGY family carbohydrate kinase [Candidatus Nanopelagicales bacterium]